VLSEIADFEPFSAFEIIKHNEYEGFIKADVFAQFMTKMQFLLMNETYASC